MKITALNSDDCRRCHITSHLLTHQMMHFAGRDGALQLEPVIHVPRLPINFSHPHSFKEELETKESKSGPVSRSLPVFVRFKFL